MYLSFFAYRNLADIFVVYKFTALVNRPWILNIKLVIFGLFVKSTANDKNYHALLLNMFGCGGFQYN